MALYVNGRPASVCSLMTSFTGHFRGLGRAYKAEEFQIFESRQLHAYQCSRLLRSNNAVPGLTEDWEVGGDVRTLDGDRDSE